MHTDLQQLGGEEALRGHVSAIVSQFFDDFVIGYLFQGRDRARIERHEFELAAQHLGAADGVARAYKGRPLAAVHKPLRINRGHFRRRLAIVRTVLGQRGVPPTVIEHWVAHEAKLEAAIVDGTDCVAPREAD